MNTNSATIIAYCNNNFTANLSLSIPEDLFLISETNGNSNSSSSTFGSDQSDYPECDFLTKEEITIKNFEIGFAYFCKIEILSIENHNPKLIKELLEKDENMKILEEYWNGGSVSLAYHDNNNKNGYLLYQTDLIYAWTNPYEKDMPQYTSFFCMITPDSTTYHGLEQLVIGERYLKQIEIEIPISFKFI